ncbi:26S proteasome subunit RPN7-domain-containing protein [Mucor mucedo]|uniref:26S proteasome subunit RPN7-domain-containing protein n=1 Tax=Mucor mucedo TaxID=29922 RepID=UPI00221EA645|nr:26S proteasome subunit RPN7-domain-containing protein [Mucor mucedo]KAI7889904.1 26S proteasome subunit RPN7-domain-containing protein [Mucor mucedo]
MTEARVEVPEDFDFETYINSYEGFTRIARSLFIAKRCDALAVEGYKTAIHEIKTTTMNTTKYNYTLDNLNAVLRSQNRPTLPADQDWITETQLRNKATLDALENELKAAKTSVTKEGIRVAHTKLGDYYYKKGDLPAAMKNYIRTRDYCATSQNIIDMCFNTIKVYLDDSNFSHVVQTYISRAESTPNITDKIDILSKLKCCHALSLLGGSDYPNRYALVANDLTEVSFESAPHFNDIMSANDVAIYGGLCALVSMDRRQLQAQILNNTNFKSFLALEPALHELIEAFYKSKYSLCFQLLENYKHSLKLDMYLASHLDILIQLVREKAMVQYCIPYSVVDMRKMAASFNIPIDELEDDLIILISRKEKIAARINSHEKILCTRKKEKRDQAFERSLVAGAEYEKASKALLLRLNMLKADLIVR